MCVHPFSYRYEERVKCALSCEDRLSSINNYALSYQGISSCQEENYFLIFSRLNATYPQYSVKRPPAKRGLRVRYRSERLIKITGMDKKNRPFKKFLKLNRKDISYVQFLIESYEGLAAVTTVDENIAIIKLSIMPDSVSDVDKILDSIRKEVDFTEERSSP